METTLVQRLKQFIITKGEHSMTQLLALGAGRYTTDEMLSALQTLREDREIQVRALVNRRTGKQDNYYRKRPPVVHKPAPERYRPSPELQAIMGSEVHDFYMHSVFVTDDERTCYVDSLKDTRAQRRARQKECMCDTHVQWRWMLMTREERAFAEFSRQREVMK